MKQWVPEELQNLVFVGAYSGATWTTLDTSDGLRQARQDADLKKAHDLLAVTPVAGLASLDLRPRQLSIRPSAWGVTARGLITAVQEYLHAEPLRVHLSGHSIDITPRTSSKATAVANLRNAVNGEVLVIGDQGQAPGNDYEMLASSQFSLSVDTVSSEPDRCWHLAPCATRGPALLAEYLKSLRLNNGTFGVITNE
jgi:hypothetical protein